MKHPDIMIFEEESMVVLLGWPAKSFADLVERVRAVKESGDAVDAERLIDHICTEIHSGNL